MPTMIYFMTMKIESRTRIHSFRESIVRKGETKISKIGWTIHMKRVGNKPNKYYGFGLWAWPLETSHYGHLT